MTIIISSSDSTVFVVCKYNATTPQSLSKSSQQRREKEKGRKQERTGPRDTFGAADTRYLWTTQRAEKELFKGV